MTSDDWAGTVMCIVGAALTLNLFGLTRGLAGMFRSLKDESPLFYASMPGTTWGWRVLGVALLGLGAAFIVVADTS